MLHLTMFHDHAVYCNEFVFRKYAENKLNPFVNDVYIKQQTEHADHRLNINTINSDTCSFCAQVQIVIMVTWQKEISCQISHSNIDLFVGLELRCLSLFVVG